MFIDSTTYKQTGGNNTYVLAVLLLSLAVQGVVAVSASSAVGSGYGTYLAAGLVCTQHDGATF